MRGDSRDGLGRRFSQLRLFSIRDAAGEVAQDVESEPQIGVKRSFVQRPSMPGRGLPYARFLAPLKVHRPQSVDLKDMWEEGIRELPADQRNSHVIRYLKISHENTSQPVRLVPS